MLHLLLDGGDGRLRSSGGVGGLGGREGLWCGTLTRGAGLARRGVRDVA